LVWAYGIGWPLAMDSLKFHLVPPCPTLLRPAGGLTGRAACAILNPLVIGDWCVVWSATRRGLKSTTGAPQPPPMGVWEGVAMDSLKYHLGLPCPTFLCSVGGPPLKRPYGHFRGHLYTGWAPCGRLLPIWTPHAVRLWPPPLLGPQPRLYSSRCSLQVVKAENLAISQNKQGSIKFQILNSCWSSHPALTVTFKLFSEKRRLSRFVRNVNHV
jgi:hypothetical protein